MSAIRVAARRLPRATRLVPSVESPIQRRFATSNVAQAKVIEIELDMTLEVFVTNKVIERGHSA